MRGREEGTGGEGGLKVRNCNDMLFPATKGCRGAHIMLAVCSLLTSIHCGTICTDLQRSYCAPCMLDTIVKVNEPF